MEYFDYLGYLLLHIFICEDINREYERFGSMCMGDVLNFLIPELNDLYTGWVTTQKWRIKYHNLIKCDKDAYFELAKRFENTCKEHLLCDEQKLYISFNEVYGLWENNIALYKKLKSLPFLINEHQ